MFVGRIRSRLLRKRFGGWRSCWRSNEQAHELLLDGSSISVKRAHWTGLCMQFGFIVTTTTTHTSTFFTITTHQLTMPRDPITIQIAHGGPFIPA